MTDLHRLEGNVRTVSVFWWEKEKFLTTALIICEWFRKTMSNYKTKYFAQMEQ